MVYPKKPATGGIKNMAIPEMKIASAQNFGPGGLKIKLGFGWGKGHKSQLIAKVIRNRNPGSKSKDGNASTCKMSDKPVTSKLNS